VLFSEWQADIIAAAIVEAGRVGLFRAEVAARYLFAKAC
jgi:hypothetical protein